MNPTLKIILNRGRDGVLLSKLAGVAKAASLFLESLSEDLGESGKWVAERFGNGSVYFDLENPGLAGHAQSEYCRALRSIMKNDVTDDFVNVRVRRETRLKYNQIAAKIEPDDFIEFSIYSDGVILPDDTYRLDISGLAQIAVERPAVYHYHGEIQGIVHSFFKEAKRPKLVIRDLSTKELVDCYFKRDMYLAAVDLLKDEDAVIFVEGMVTEDTSTGIITEISVSDFTPAPVFDLAEFEGNIGKFPELLGEAKNSSLMLDEFRGE